MGILGRFYSLLASLSPPKTLTMATDGFAFSCSIKKKPALKKVFKISLKSFKSLSGFISMFSGVGRWGRGGGRGGVSVVFTRSFTKD